MISDPGVVTSVILQAVRATTWPVPGSRRPTGARRATFPATLGVVGQEVPVGHEITRLLAAVAARWMSSRMVTSAAARSG
jgi:hypothetical protein